MNISDSARMFRSYLMTRRRETSCRWVARAIKNGNLLPPSAYLCKDCGNQAACYDHRDYRKPDMVDPVCYGCDSKRGEAEPSLKEYFSRQEIVGLIGQKIQNDHLRYGRPIMDAESICSEIWEFLDIPRYKVWAALLGNFRTTQRIHAICLKEK